MTKLDRGVQADKQINELQSGKPFPWRGLAIALFSIVGFLLLGLSMVWLLSKQGIIPASWSQTIFPIFSLMGIAIGWVVNNIFNKDFFQQFNQWVQPH